MKQDITERTIQLEGFTPLMFDRYAGDNKTNLAPNQKLYFMPDGKTLCLPAINLMSFLTAKNTMSSAKLIGGKSWQALANAFLAYVSITPNLIPITRNGTPIVFHGFVDDQDTEADIYVHRCVARLPKGIPNPKERPVINLPWAIEFKLSLFKNSVCDETLLRRAFDQGGIALGMGTYRGVFGKFSVVRWE